MNNSPMPVANFKNEIVSLVRDNDIVIIQAETGAGKSTLVPIFLLEAGYSCIVTQPRRLAARSVAARAASLLSEKIGNTVGVRTRDDYQENVETKLLFCTDGLALVRELMSNKNQKYNILIIDEVHEWNLNIETLIAWVKSVKDRNFKVVIMSATMESQKLSEYFDNAPVLSVPGRLFEIEEKAAGKDIFCDVADLVKDGRNVLVFQPGKKEIQETISNLQAMKVNAEILPLHGELSLEEQSKVFQNYGRSKVIISTNVAQTSVTIPDIDAVVDSGLERRTEVYGGVEGLYTRAISYACSKQRKGRAGRTKPGVYIDHCYSSEREEFPKPEILRTCLDQTFLRLAEAGIDMEEMNFFHQPEKSEVHHAKEKLELLGCLKDGKITQKGKVVARFPVSTSSACMLLEAEKRGCVYECVKVVALLEIGGITINKDEHGNRATPWKKFCQGEESSDVLAQLKVYDAAKNMKKDEFRKNGIMTRAYFQVIELERHLCEVLRNNIKIKKEALSEEVLNSNLRKCIIVGMIDGLYNKNGFNFCQTKPEKNDFRELNKESVVNCSYYNDEHKFIVGKPWNLQIQTRRGSRVLNLITLATRATKKEIEEVVNITEKIVGCCKILSVGNIEIERRYV